MINKPVYNIDHNELKTHLLLILLFPCDVSWRATLRHITSTLNASEAPHDSSRRWQHCSIFLTMEIWLNSHTQQNHGYTQSEDDDHDLNDGVLVCI